MELTPLGWDVIDSGSSPRLVNFPWVTGKVRGGDHYVVLDYIARRWNAEVHPITKAHSWAYAKRPARGSTLPSEHSAGIALDFDAPLFPMGVPITKCMTTKQIAAARQIIKDVRAAARWGGEWKRPDGMHVELMGGNAKVSEVADLIRAGKLPSPGKPSDVKPAGKPSTPKPQAKPATKSVATMAAEVIAGKHGSGHDVRRKSLGVSSAVYAQVRAEVNQRAGGKSPAKAPAKSVSTMATEVIQGKHGNGHPARQKSLGVNSATYAKVRAEVNKRL